MAKSKPADKKAVKADATKALKNGGGKVTKAAEAPKATAKSIAKSAAAKVDGGKDKKSKKAVKAPEPESDSSEEEEDEEMDDSSSASSDSEEESEDESESDSASEAEPAPKANGVNGTAKKTNGVAAKKAQDSDDSSSEEDSEEESDDEPAAAAAAAKDDDDDSSEEDDSSEDDSEAEAKPKASATNGVNGHKAADDEEDSDDSDSDSSEDDDEEEAAAPQQKKRKAEAEAESAPKKTKTANGNESKNLFIGNLSWNVTEDMLAEEFSSFGEITGCRIVTDRQSGRSKGFGYVEFGDLDAAIAAHESKKGALLDGRELNVDFSTPRPERPAGDRPSWQDRAKDRGDQVGKPADTLFLGNLPFNTSNEEIHQAFSEYGTVTRVSLPTDRETGAPKGFGYVSFTSIDEAKAAYEALQGQDYNGRPIRMDYAQPRADNGGGGGGFGGRGQRGGGFGRGGGRGGRGGDRGRGRGGARGGRPPSTNRGGFGDFSGSKTTF